MQSLAMSDPALDTAPPAAPRRRKRSPAAATSAAPDVAPRAALAPKKRMISMGVRGLLGAGPTEPVLVPPPKALGRPPGPRLRAKMMKDDAELLAKIQAARVAKVGDDAGGASMDAASEQASARCALGLPCCCHAAAGRLGAS